MSEQFSIPRILDVSDSGDRELLRQSAIVAPVTLSLIDRFIEDYLALFPEPHWRKIYSGPFIAIPLAGIFELTKLLEITEMLLNLKNYPGFQKLLAGFRDPRKVKATLFEVQAAKWCSERAVSLSLEFSPGIFVKDRLKYPDFLWRTKLGNLYCECKSGSEVETKFGKRFQRLDEVVRANYNKRGPWDTQYRIDIRMASTTKNGIEKRIENVLNQASAALTAKEPIGTILQNGDVAVRLSHREDLLHDENDILRSGQILVTTEPTQLVGVGAHKNWQYSLTMALQKERQRLTAKLLKDARTQLPTSGSSCVFIELGGGEAARQDLQTRLADPAYSNSPWVSIWVGGKFYAAVWRKGQQLDDCLTK